MAKWVELLPQRFCVLVCGGYAEFYMFSSCLIGFSLLLYCYTIYRKHEDWFCSIAHMST